MRILRAGIVKNRKEHRCSACERIFPKGTLMYKEVNTYDRIGTWRECKTCRSLLEKFGSIFFDDNEQVFPSGCVEAELKRGQTPEELLYELENQIKQQEEKQWKLLDGKQLNHTQTTKKQ